MHKEIPILFNTSMVKAILEGKKTMTRRIVKPQPYIDKSNNFCWNGMCFGQSIDRIPHIQAIASPIPSSRTKKVLCPYGKPGDILWVRETYYAFGKWVKNGLTKTGKQKYKFCDYTKNNQLPYYFPDNIKDNVNPIGIVSNKSGRESGEVRWFKRPSLFMPKSACRIYLEVTDIRVERLHDITEEDAKAEGVFVHNVYPSPRMEFASLWDKINPEQNWNTNPWVWVVSFKVLSTTGKPVQKEVANG